MRINWDFHVFAGHPEWYTIEKGKGYIPTEKAPEEAKEAMKRYNEWMKKQEDGVYV